MFAPEHSSQARHDATAANPHRASPRAARACFDASAHCIDSFTPRRTLLRGRRPGPAARAPQRCLVAEAVQTPS